MASAEEPQQFAAENAPSAENQSTPNTLNNENDNFTSTAKSKIELASDRASDRAGTSSKPFPGSTLVASGKKSSPATIPENVPAESKANIPAAAGAASLQVGSPVSKPPLGSPTDTTVAVADSRGPTNNETRASTTADAVDGKTQTPSAASQVEPSDSSQLPAAPPAVAAPAAMCIKIVPASSVPSLRNNIPPDLNVLAQIEPQSDGSEIIVPLGVFDRQMTMLGVAEALRRFAGENYAPVADADNTLSDSASAPAQTDAVSKTERVTAVPIPIGSNAATVPLTAASSVFMPAGGFIMMPPSIQRSSNEVSGVVPDDTLAAAKPNAVVDEKPAQKFAVKRAAGIFRVKPNTTKLLGVDAAGTENSHGTVNSRKFLSKGHAATKKLNVVERPDSGSNSADKYDSATASSVVPEAQKPTLFANGDKESASAQQSSISLLTKPLGKKVIRAADVEKPDSPHSKQSSPASHEILFRFTLPKNVTERVRELQRVSQRTTATKAERDAAKSEMDNILDKHRHGATTVYEGDDVKDKTNSARILPVDEALAPTAAKPVARKPAVRKGPAATKPVNTQPTTISDKFASNLDAAALFDDSVDVKPPATTSVRPAFTLKRPIGLNKATTVGQVLAAQQKPIRHDIVTNLKAASLGDVAVPSPKTPPTTTKSRPRPRAAAQRAKMLQGTSSVPDEPENKVLPVKVEPAETSSADTTPAIQERKTYTTIRPKRAKVQTPAKPKTAATPAKPAALARRNNASSSNLSIRSDSASVDDRFQQHKQPYATPVKPFRDDVSTPHSDYADSQALSEDTTRRSGSHVVKDEDDATNGLVIDDDLSQAAVSSRLRRRKSVTTETADDDVTQYAEKLLQDDAELEKFFRELDDHLNDEFGADSELVDAYYSHVSARVDVECQLDQWTTETISPTAESVTAAAVTARNIVDKNDIFGPLDNDENEDNDTYCETQLVRKRPADLYNNEEAENLLHEADLTWSVDGKKQPLPQTKRQKATKLARIRAKPEHVVGRFIDTEISRLEKHLADLPTWKECDEPPEQVLMRFHLLQEGNCVRWARVRGHVLPVPYKLPFDVEESELRRQDGIFETIAHDLITRKQRLLETGRAMLLNDQLKKHVYGPLEEHCILLRGLVDNDEFEAQNIRHEQYNIQTALYNAYGPYVASYTPEMHTRAVASLAGVGPAPRPGDIKHYADWFEAQDQQLQAAAALAALASSSTATSDVTTSSATLLSPGNNLAAVATTLDVSASRIVVSSPRPTASNIFSQPATSLPETTTTTVSSSFYAATEPSVLDGNSIFPAPSFSVSSEVRAAPIAPPTVPETYLAAVQHQPFAADDIFGPSTDAPLSLAKHNSIEEDLPSTPPPPVLERMAETPSSLLISPTKSVSSAAATETNIVDSAGKTSLFGRLASDSDSANRNTLSSVSSATTREPREQHSSASNSRGQIFNAASIFGEASDSTRRSRSASGSHLSVQRRSSLIGSSHSNYADERTKRHDADDESDDVPLPELEAQPQEQRRSQRRNSLHGKRRRRGSADSESGAGGRRRRKSSPLFEDDEDHDEDEHNVSLSESSGEEALPPQLSQRHQSTPPPTQFKLTLKRAPLRSEASISSRTRNRRAVGSTGQDADASGSTNAGGWSVAVVAAAGATKPSPSTASSSSIVVKSDKSERRKRRRRRHEREQQQEPGNLRRNNSDLSALQPQKRYGTRLATKTIADDAKLERKERHRRGRRRRRRRRNDSAGSALTDKDAEEEQRSSRRKYADQQKEVSDDENKKSEKHDSDGDDDAATPPPLLEPMLGGAAEEIPSARTKATPHAPANKHVASHGRTSTSDAAASSWLDSVFGDSGGRLSSTSRHHPHAHHHRHESGGGVHRSSTSNNAVHHTAATGSTLSRLDTADDDAVFDDLLDSEFDLSSFLSGNDMHNVLITSSNSMTPTLGSGVVTMPHHLQQHSHLQCTTESSSVVSGSHHQSEMISQGNVFGTHPAHFLPVSQQNIPNGQHHNSQIFTYAAPQPTSGHGTVMISQPVLHIPPANGIGTSIANDSGIALSYASTINIGSSSSVMPPALTTSFGPPISSAPLLVASAPPVAFAVVSAPPPPPLSTTNLDALF